MNNKNTNRPRASLLFCKAMLLPGIWKARKCGSRICLAALLIICCGNLAAQEKYAGMIYLPANADKDLKTATDDMAYWLQKATDKPFRQEEDKGQAQKGIILRVIDKNSGLPENIQKQVTKDGQSFYLQAEENKVVITGTATPSLINGIYTFLEELGFRFYMPGDLWTIVPASIKQLRSNKVYSPDFTNRFYFGSGGIAPIPGIDPADEFSKDYILWNRRNRIASDYVNKGHSGLAFYRSMSKELEVHPEYSCDGKVNKNGWIDIGNKTVVELFIKWALSQARPGTRFPSIGVDPADGSGSKGDCMPANMPEIKSWSDKYFWLANKVAERLNKNDDSTRVMLYAYNQHAAPPNFSLKKNVYPVIIPYAFQNVAEPEVFISQWVKKMDGRPMGIYDYWNITQWGKCLPDFNIYSVPQKLKLWKKQNITTINLESTYSKGSMGHIFWIATQLMWNADAPFEKLYNEFLNDCFGEAAQDIRRMYDRWSLNYQGAMEYSLSLHDLSLAASKTKNPDVRRRISMLKAYVKYIDLYYKYMAEGSVANYETLIKYIYSIHHFQMVHTWALASYYIPRPKGYKLPADRKIIEANNRQIKKLDVGDVDAEFNRSISSSPEPYKISSLKWDMTKIIPAKSSGKKTSVLYINNKNTYQFRVDSRKKITFQAGSGNDTRFLIQDMAGKPKLDRIIKGTPKEYTTVETELSPGEYVLTYGAPLRFSRLIFPEGMVFVSDDYNYDNAGFPLLYIYIPTDVDEVVYTDEYGPGTNNRGFWLDPSGKKIMPEKIAAKTYRVKIPAEYRGKAWTFNIGHRKFRLLNIPALVSLQEFIYNK